MNLYKQYLDVKKQHPDALVFYRVGDFYELFGEDAITASGLLDLTLTSRDCGQPERVPMCGVPHHTVDAYISKLVKDGIKTAICEPTKELPAAEYNPAAPEPKTHGRLNLTATGTEQTILLDYLEQNASDILAEKINNGVKIVKDGKTLISKKTLETFMKYACDEAQKLAEKGARAACVKSDTVFGWLIHYFEESSIEGTLYNEDGTEYKPPKPVRTTAPKTAPSASVVTASPKPKPMTLFDLFDTPADADKKPQTEPAAAAKPDEDETEQDEPDTGIDEIDADSTDESDAGADEIDADNADEPEEEEKIPNLRQISETEYVDDDGVIYSEVSTQPEDKEISVLLDIFGGALKVR